MAKVKNCSVPNRTLTIAFIVSFTFLLLAGPALAQDPAPGKKDTKRMEQGALKEAQVTAKIITTVEEVGPMRVRLNVLNPTGKPVRISIRNYENQPVFEDAFREREYNKVLNFNSTIPGRYSLHVAGRKSSEVRRFEVASNEKKDMTASPPERPSESDVAAAIYKASPTRIMLHMVNNTGKPVEYVFRNTEKEIIYRGYVKEQKFAKAFDMSKVTDGKYTVEVSYLTDKAATRSFDVSTVYERDFNWVDKRGKPIMAEK